MFTHFPSSGSQVKSSVCGLLNNSLRSENSTVHFIVPVIFYSLLYNIPKFFELKVSCDSLADHNTTELEMKENETESDCNYKLEGRDFR